MTQRWKIVIEYDGSNYYGWQRQQDLPSIQQSIEEGILAFSGEKVIVHASGRTDAGVHAYGQVAHFDMEKDFTAKEIRDAPNHHMGDQPIAILSATKVDSDFNARFDAKKRYYKYVIKNRPTAPVIGGGYYWHMRLPLDVDAMQQAANHLIGQHDFTSFRDSQCQAKSPIKTLDQLDIYQEGDDIIFEVSARSFLHHQVRNFVGTLVKVGSGSWEADSIKDILDARDRTKAGPTAPSDGLFFVSIDY